MIKEKIGEAIEYAKKGDIKKLELWLEQGNDINQHDQSGWTPLLWAAARGNYQVVEMLLKKGASSRLAHKKSAALPIHMAGHSGNVKTAELLLDDYPESIDAVWDLNGHTVLLQASFYGHLELAKFVVENGADTSITTARGLGPMEMAAQFQNQAMMDIIRPYDSSAEKKAEYYKKYLARITPIVPAGEKEKQELSDRLVATIESGIKAAFQDPTGKASTMNAVKELIEVKKADVNWLGGILRQPPLIVVVTGNNGFPAVNAVAELRYELAEYLLKNGADPTKREDHPMGAQTIIRAAVFNHLDILKMCANYMSAEVLADAINEYPVVNGLTALHDTVLRASTAGADKVEGYLAQCKWFMEHGGKSDIEDFSGRTQKNIAENCRNEETKRRLLELL